MVTEKIWKQKFFQKYIKECRYGLLKEAMEKIIAKGLTITDEAAAMEFMGHRPQIIEGSKFNIKITHEQDLILAGMILDLKNGES